MAVGALLRYARDTFFSKPSAERELVKLARKQRVRRVVELGIGSLERTQALLKEIGSADKHGVSYCAIDLFDQRPQASAALPLIAVHRVVSGLAESVRLAPGEVETVLPTVANTLADTDLILLPAEALSSEASPLWFYLPRMCHPGTLVLWLDEADAEAPAWRQTPLLEIESRAQAARSHRQPLRAAA